MNDFELTQTILAERQEINPRTRRRITWDEIAIKHAGVSKGLVWKIANKESYVVKDNEIRKRLELDILAPAPVCLQCGDVHTTKRCTKNRKRNATSDRIAISKRNMASTARTIRRHITAENKAELISLLKEVTQ